MGVPAPQDGCFPQSSRQSQSSKTRLICIASERHDETNLLDKVNAVGTLHIRDGDHEQLALVRPGKDAGVAQLLAVVVEDDAHAAVVEILVSAVQRAAAWIIFAPPAASKVNCSVPPYAARDSSISAWVISLPSM